MLLREWQGSLIITFASSKGGVGKSTSCVALAGAYVKAGARVHIVDLDNNRTVSRWLADDKTRPENLTVSTPDPQILTEHIQEAVPSLVKPAPERPSGGQRRPQDSPNQEPRPSPSRTAQDSPRAKKTTIPTPAPVERLMVELPGYLTDATKRYAAENRTSMRHIVMRGLEALGFEIASGDLLPDGRRRTRRPGKR